MWASAAQGEWTLRASQRLPFEWGKIQPDAPPVHVPRPQNTRFQGQYLDPDPRLHYNSFRFYEPDIGRFINPDPVGTTCTRTRRIYCRGLILEGLFFFETNEIE
ncbi:RHS repeat-associated core domain-containing protein [Burkholderia sp. Ac-20349]|uniref:RHS repeat-associated core domain-containing protein n=1 Tax=Burkholderia sp. Ac-20349 TaxID=2703893 RepID=UPI0032177D24